MGEAFGADFGERVDCRVCRMDRFLVERGHGTVNDKPVTVLTIRCSRCGTVFDHLQVDWQASVTEEDKVVIADGIKR